MTPLKRYVLRISLLLAYWLSGPAGLESAPQAAPNPASVSAPAALDLVSGESGEELLGWTLPPKFSEQGYKAMIVSDAPNGSTRSAKLVAPASASENDSFGVLRRSLDATPYRDKVVRFQAAVRSEGAGGPDDRAQLWLRIDRPGGEIGFFDDMSDRPVREKMWGRYDILAKVPPDATSISLGLLVFGAGSALVSAPNFALLGDAAADEPAGPLDARGLDNLVALTRLLGLVRYFHPSDQAAVADWNRFAVTAIRSVEVVSGPDELARTLQRLFQPVAPTLRVFRAAHPAALPPKVSRPPMGISSPRIVAWRHRGLGLGVDSGGRMYRSERVDQHTPDLVSGEAHPVGTVLPRPDQPLRVDLGGGVAAIVPLALYADGNGTLPPPAPDSRPKESAAPFLPSANDRATRLADAALAWNVFEHFYPYFDVIPSDWPSALRRALLSAATDRDEKDFLKTLRRLVANLHDGHGDVTGTQPRPSRSLPFLWDWIEDRLVVTQTDREQGAGILPGDVVLSIDRQPVQKVLSAEEDLISGATPQWRRWKALQSLLAGPPGEVELEVRHASGETRSVKVSRSIPLGGPGALLERRPEKIAEVAPGVMYLDVERAEDSDWSGVLPRLQQARGIVFDFRGYTNLSTTFLQHLIDRPVHSAEWRIPVVTRPDREGVRYSGTRWTLPPLAPRLTAKLAFITDGRAISYAESCLGIVEAYHLGAIVGGPTAGTNGDINFFTLPGGFHVRFTGMQVLKQDGSRHHGVGVKPTIPVSRTLRGVTEGRDELLERAISVVSP